MKLSVKGASVSRFTLISLIVTGVLILLWGVLTFAMSGTTQRSGPAKTDPTKCPDCGRTLPKSAQIKGECPYCSAENGGKPKRSSLKNEGGLLQSSAVPFALIGLFCVLLSVNVAVIVRSRMGKKTEDVYFHVHCAKCGRKVRYRTKQQGHFARCPICRVLMRFPEAEAKAKGPWARMASWLKPSKKQRKDSA